MENFFFLALGFVCAVVLAVMIIPNILFASYKRRLFDMPNYRKVHKRPVSRLGGVSFFPVISISFCLILGIQLSITHYGWADLSHPVPYSFLFLCIGCMTLYMIGLMDDIVGVGYRYKFIAQILAATLLALSGSYINTLGGLFGVYSIPAWLGIPLTVFLTIYITNAINLIDGIDGLASGLSIIALTVFCGTFIYRGNFIYSLLTLGTLGVLLPFWVYNVFGYTKHHHKLFMGDTGALTLGFILSFIVIRLCSVREAPSQTYELGVIIAGSALFIPLLDVIRVVIHRISHGKSPFLPDRNHIHHKLLDTGMPLRMVMLTILAMAVFFILLSSLLAKYTAVNTTVILLIDVAVWLAFIFTIDYRIRIRIRNKNNHQI